jgi:hypothetical protein
MVRKAFLTATALGAIGAGCSSGADDRVLVHVEPSASRAGLPPPPRVVEGERSQRALRRAQRAHAERVEAAVPRVRNELRRLGATDVSVRRAHGVLFLRARVPAAEVATLERRDDVSRVWHARTLTGRVERDDLVLLLAADDGDDYVLGQVGTHGLLGGERVRVEGSDWRGASTVWHHRGHNFIARIVERLPD